MSVLNAENRALWTWLLQSGQQLTAHEVARELALEPEETFHRLHAMARRRIVEQLPPAEGSHRKRYAVTGTCLVPAGMRIAEVQA